MHKGQRPQTTLSESGGGGGAWGRGPKGSEKARRACTQAMACAHSLDLWCRPGMLPGLQPWCEGAERKRVVKNIPAAKVASGEENCAAGSTGGGKETYLITVIIIIISVE